MRTRVGYAGGTSADPTYQRLGDHTETIEVDYDPSAVGYDELLDVFWRSHDARRSAHSTQYRSAVFFRTEQEREAAEAAKARIEAALGPVRTVIEPLRHFYRAEDYHQKYRLRSRRAIMADFRAMFPHERAFVDSTAAARANGWLDGCGSTEGIERDLPLMGLTDAAREELRALVLRPAARGGYVGR